MAAIVLTNATIKIGAAWTGTAPGLPGTQTSAGTITSPSDISAYCTSVQLPLMVGTEDSTNFGSGGFRSVIASIKSTDISLALNNDFAASALNDILRTTVGGLGSTVYVDITPTSAARSATNPSYVFAVILTQIQPVSGAIGNINAMSITWPSTGAFATLTA
jgi:hypothetical protein